MAMLQNLVRIRPATRQVSRTVEVVRTSSSTDEGQHIINPWVYPGYELKGIDLD
jgi:hypothetical protein